MKYFGVLALIVLATCVANALGQSHNYEFGHVGPSDTLLQQHAVSKKGKFLRVVEEDVTYPLPGQIGRIITGIKVVDGYTDEKGGYAKIVHGGPGNSFVKVNLKSQRSQGLKFVVQIFGH